jgi:hypothetical protein
MSDWPGTAKWLLLRRRMSLQTEVSFFKSVNRISNVKIVKSEGTGGKTEVLNLKIIKRAHFDWKIYICAAMVCCTTVTVYSIAILAPTIINQ